MKLKRDTYDSYGIFDVRWRLQLIEMSFSDEIRGYWLYESVISLILGFRGCKEEKMRITVKNVSFGGSARLRTGLLTDRPREICERISKSSRAHRSSCHLVSALQRKEWPLLHEERLVERNRSTSRRFGGDLGFNWNLKMAQRDLSIGRERWRWRPDLRAWVGAKFRQNYRALQPAPSSLS